MLHILVGIAAAVIIWKMIKVTFRSLIWFILAGILAFIFFPKALAFVGGIGFLIVGFLVALIVLAVAACSFGKMIDAIYRLIPKCPCRRRRSRGFLLSINGSSLFIERSVRNFNGVRWASILSILKIIVKVFRNLCVTGIAIVIVNHFRQSFIIVVVDVGSGRTASAASDACVFFRPR